MVRGMAGFVWSHVCGRAGRSVALLAGVLVATTGFTVLTGTTATARLRVTGTVDANAHAAYDVLVRPKGTRTSLEAERGLVRPNYLSGLFGGLTMRQYEQVRRISGVDVAAPIAMVSYANVFQRYHLLPALTALDNVIAPVLPYRVAYDRAERARQLLDAVGLAGRERALPAQLSGGQQQRVAIARALMGEPRLLLADEPTGNLDSANGTQVLDLLLDLREQHGMTVLLATHEQHIAARCDRLIRLTDGRLVEDLDLTDGEDPATTLARATRLRL